MDKVIRLTGRGAVALVLLAWGVGRDAWAQGTAPGVGLPPRAAPMDLPPPSPMMGASPRPLTPVTAAESRGPAPAPRRRGLRALFWRGERRAPATPAGPGFGVRRVQATAADTARGANATTSSEGTGPSPPPVFEPGGPPVSPNADLSLPRAERPEGGGGPTEALAEEEAEAEAEEPAELVLPGPFFLNNRILQAQDSPVKFYGWIQNSFTGNANGRPANGLNFGVNPNNLADQWQGNQYYLVVENALEQNDTVNFGFRVDNLFGNDATFNHMHGLFDTGYKANNFLAYDPAQIYGEVHLPILTKGGLDIKGGRWYTLAGYEVVPAPGRPLLSVPYMFNYGQPFTHFGALSTLHLNPQVNLFNGVINGWDRWIDTKYKWGYIGGFSWTSKDTRWGWTTILVWGPQQQPYFLPTNTRFGPTGSPPVGFLAGRKNLGYGGNDRTLFTTVLTHKWDANGRLTQVIETDQAFENNIPGTGPGGTNQNASWYSFGNWFLYGINDKLTGVWRSEIFRDNNGVRTGLATNYSEITLGAIYKPKPWIWIRPESRYDWVRSGHPYNDGTRSSQLTLAFDVILFY